ncbi:hypothetical protein CRUP_032627 [Coryphaenoides rupestris]|nr:hypothetical protein CRUP_032627 [Coryphaenoides rupestris]
MPFLGKDWRSPGQSWVKTEEGWKKSSTDIAVDSYCHDNKNTGEEQEKEKENENENESLLQKKKESVNQENLLLSLGYDMPAKKRKKDLLNNNTKVPYFHMEKWIYLLELIAKSKLPSLSGVAQKNYMNILERVVQKVLDDQQNLRPIKELLQTLYVSLCGLVQDMGKSVLVGNLSTWVHRMENILQWQQQLDSIQINRPTSKGLTLGDLPASLQLNIMHRLSDGRDLVSLGQVSPALEVLSEDRLLWKGLCHHHFTDRQIRKRLLVSERGHLEWQKMYFKLVRCYPRRQDYCETLHFCTHCHILFWKDTQHPCTANNPESCTVALAPQDFIDLFNF